jgi:DNA mismatch repair protein MutL
MAKILELSKEIIEQIAAGEVVESPASVVKELIENAIDAGSNKIFIEIEDGGKSLIRISDDGIGMSRTDAILSIKRHATSKIKDLVDLFDIHSLGFRGEALSAVSTVSKFELITKAGFDVEGTRVRLIDGEPQTETVACPKGTTIIVKDLFYNTPARKKYLRASSFEASKITDIITKYALANPLIYFKLTNNGKTTLNSPNTPSMLNNIVDIYGNEIAKQLFKVDYKDDLYTITGFISKPSFSRSDKDLINFYINKRYVKNKTIIDAVYDSYHTLLHQNRYPFAMMHVTVNPKRLDVNIHPAKTKIKIEQEGKLYEIIYDIVRDTLKSNDILSTPAIEEQNEIEVENNSILTTEKAADVERKYNVQVAEQLVLKEESINTETIPTRKPLNIDTSTHKEIQDDSIVAESSAVYQDDSISNDELASEYLKKTVEEPKDVVDTSEKKQAKMRILGQIYKTYILLETKKGLAILDQHAAHERVLFEKMLKDSMNMTFGKQELLSPLKISVDARTTSVVESNKGFLKQVGFELEAFGGGTYLVRSVPVIFAQNQDKQFLLDLITDILNHGKINALDKMKQEVLNTMSCKAAIKAGDELTRDQMKDLVYEFFNLDMAYTCPHGRPIVVELSIEELEKRFKRTGF